MTTWVLLRGLARESRHWGDFPRQLQQTLPATDRVLTLDLPGNGARCRETSPATVEGMVDAARRALAEGPHRGPYRLVALSLGAMVALHWARLAPREVQDCVLINTSLGRFSPFWQRLQPGSWGPLLRVLLAKDALQREQSVLALTSNLPVSMATAQTWADLARDCPATRANVLRQLWAAARHGAPRDPLPVPTLLLASERDRLVAAACSRAIAVQWQLPLVLHPNAGHDLPLDDPAWVIARLTAWAQRP